MSITRYLLSMLFATVVSWGAFLLVLFNVDPVDGGAAGRGLFLGSLFFSLFGTLSLAGFLCRIMLRKDVPLYYQVMTSFRQALLFAVVVVAGLILQALRVLTWWNSLLLILFTTMIELFFLTRAAHSYREG